MGGICFSYKITPLNSTSPDNIVDDSDTLEDDYHAYMAENLEHLDTLQLEDDLLYYMNEALLAIMPNNAERDLEDAYSTIVQCKKVDDTICFTVKDYQYTISAAQYHWLQLIAVMRSKELLKLAQRHGYELHLPQPKSAQEHEEYIHSTIDYPLVKIHGEYAILLQFDVEPFTIYFYETLTKELHEFSNEEQQRFSALYKSRGCECELCRLYREKFIL